MKHFVTVSRKNCWNCVSIESSVLKWAWKKFKNVEKIPLHSKNFGTKLETKTSNQIFETNFSWSKFNFFQSISRRFVVWKCQWRNLRIFVWKIWNSNWRKFETIWSWCHFVKWRFDHCSTSPWNLCDQQTVTKQTNLVVFTF